MTSAKGAVLKPLVVDDLLARARREAGLEDFGDSWFMEPLSRLVQFINTEGNLVSTDIAMVDQIVRCLSSRLKLVAYLKEHPAVVDEELDVVGVIIGLPRGGSTLAQRLLGSSPQLTSIRKYEVYAPIPFPGEEPGDPTPRIEHAQREIDAMTARWPDMKSMHPMTPTDYEEEIELIDCSFASVMYFLYFHLPSYAEWLFDYDDSKSYEELKLWLKLLQYRDESRRGSKWFLKSPQHLLSGSLRICMQAFPNAKMLMTHRPLRSVIGSYTNLKYSMLKDVTRELDPKVLGPESIDVFKKALERMIEVRDEGSADRFVDLQYADLVSDPIEQFEYALTRMGLTVTAADKDAAINWMAANPRSTHPPHHYRMEDYGVDPDRFERIFAFYHDRFVKPVHTAT
jgi:hypothetical protein